MASTAHEMITFAEFCLVYIAKEKNYTIARQRRYPSGAAMLPRVLLPFYILQVAVEESWFPAGRRFHFAASTVANSREGSAFQNAHKGLEVVSGSRAES